MRIGETSFMRQLIPSPYTRDQRAGIRLIGVLDVGKAFRGGCGREGEAHTVITKAIRAVERAVLPFAP